MLTLTRRTGAGLCAAGLMIVAAAPACAEAAGDQAVNDISKMSIEELGQIQVTSVSKRAQPLNAAPSSIYVITHEQILRSGATRLPDILRLAPNLYVAQTSANNWVVTARGFSGDPQAQAFSDKLLVLIDGRSVYTPLFSGVYWDMQDVLPGDIDRIEVISGPGATLWGANAVNGVINIITRRSSETQGGVAVVDEGDYRRGASLRYGGKINDDMTYRVYAKALHDDNNYTATGARAQDEWTSAQAGFRFDWTASAADAVAIQGDATHGTEALLSSFDGANLLTRWNHSFGGGGELQVQAYVDHERRGHDYNGGTPFWINTFDVDAQHSFQLGARNAIVWGGGLRVSRYAIAGTPNLFFEPRSRTLDLGDLFAEDTITLAPKVNLTLGLKAESDPYAGTSLLPNVRLAWAPSSQAMLWAAASQAIRSPTPFDTDVVEQQNGLRIIAAHKDFQPEKLTAYELGGRFQPIPRLSFSVSGYYNVYDDLRSIEFTPATVFPIYWGNMLKGHTAGVEAWGDFQATSWWRLSAGVNRLAEDLSFKPGAAGFLGTAQAGDDPRNQETLHSSMDIGPAVTFDADLRHVGALPDPAVPAYTELNLHLAWNISDRLQLAVTGLNLLHARHLEYAGANEIPRSVMAELRWGF